MNMKIMDMIFPIIEPHFPSIQILSTVILDISMEEIWFIYTYDVTVHILWVHQTVEFLAVSKRNLHLIGNMQFQKL